MHCLSNMHGSIHAEILRDNIADAQELHPSCGTLHVAIWLVALSSFTAVLAWPRRFRLLALQACIPSGQTNIEGKLCNKVWDGVHVCPRTAPLSQTLGNIVSKMGLGGTSPPFVTSLQEGQACHKRRQDTSEGPYFESYTGILMP